jgi:hypothetical protein
VVSMGPLKLSLGPSRVPGLITNNNHLGANRCHEIPSRSSG